jgi:site-specific DNA recombinase
MTNLGIIRLSLVRGDTQTGPVRQREEITKKYGYLGVKPEEITWAEDLDVSAFRVAPMKRPSLRKALLSLPPGSNIMFYRLDRFIRRVFPDWSDMLAFAAIGQHRLVSATEPIDLSDLTGQMAATLFAFVGEMESRNTGLRIGNTRQYLRRNGRWAGGSMPYGYRPEKLEGKPGKYLTTDATAHVYLIEAGARVLKGEAVNAIIDDFNERGVSTPLDRARELRGKPPLCACGHDHHEEPCEKSHKCKHRERKEGRRYVKAHEFDECSEPCPAYERLKWTRGSLQAILRSPAVLGHVTRDGGQTLLADDGTPIQFAQPLLHPETFAAVQDALNKRAFKKVRTNTQSLLLGIAFCDCGEPYYRHASVTRNRLGREYAYDNYRERVSKNPCGSPLIKTSVLDGLVSRELLSHVGGFEIVERVESLSQEGAERNAELRMIGLQLVQLTQEMYVKGSPSQEHMNTLLKLQARHAELSAAEPAASGAVLRPTGQTFRKRWEGMETQERRMWMLDAGVRVVARRKREPNIDLPSGPLVPEDIPRSIIADEGDVHAVILLGGMAELLRHVTASLRGTRRRTRPPRREGRWARATAAHVLGVAGLLLCAVAVFALTATPLDR